VLVVRQACLHRCCVDLYAEESDAVSLFIWFFLDLKSPVAADLSEVSCLPVQCIRECCGAREDAQNVVKEVERMFPPPLRVRDPFHG